MPASHIESKEKNLKKTNYHTSRRPSIPALMGATLLLTIINAWKS